VSFCPDPKNYKQKFWYKLNVVDNDICLSKEKSNGDDES
jgi:hypothetical protein